MSVLKSLVAATALTAALAVPALAAPIPVSTFQMVGALRASGGTTFDQATAFDFGSGPTFETFDTAGGTVRLSGNLSPVFTSRGFTAGTTGTIQDISSLSVGTKNLTNFYLFTAGGNTLALNLNAITDILRFPQNGSASPTINVYGTGTLNLTGFEATSGIFSLTTTNTGTGVTATFQSSVSSGGEGTGTNPAVVPEPASMALLGLGLAGLGLLRRRTA